MTNAKQRAEPPSAPESAATMLLRTREHAAANKEVVAAVESRSDTATREERRMWLEEELHRRGLTRDAIWLEQRLDYLESSRSRRARHKMSGIVKLGVLLGSLVRTRHQEAAAPRWMNPPLDAQVDVCSPLIGAPSGTQTSTVVLDASVESLLERAITESPVRAGDLVPVVVWFDRTFTGDSPVTVNLGSHKIGAVDRSVAHLVGEYVDVAALQGQRPQAHGVLSRADHRAPPYILLVTIPTRRT